MSLVVEVSVRFILFSYFFVRFVLTRVGRVRIVISNKFDFV